MQANILNLARLRGHAHSGNRDDYHIYAEVKNGTLRCAGCGDDNIVGHGRNEQVIRDLAMHGKRIGIYVDARRFRCRACSKTFMDPLP